MFVKRLDAHRPDPFGNQIANRIIRHRRGDAGFKPEAIGKIGRNIKFAARDVNIAMSGLAKRDDARVKPMNQSAERQKIQRAILADVQNLLHVIVKVVPRVGVEPTTN